MSAVQSKNGVRGLKLQVVERGERPTQLANDVHVAEIDNEIVFDQSVLDTYHYDGWQLVHHDLLVVCAAIEFADRQCLRGAAQWPREFQLLIPVQELLIWQRPEVLDSLRDTLRHLTGDNWHFSFTQAKGRAESGFRQRALPFGSNKQFAIAYSDGLDSRCVSGIFDAGDIAVRVRMKRNRDKKKIGEQPFDLIPFDVKPPSPRESGVRTRGFKFAAITAIAGHVAGVSRVIVPESGQGALGPALLPLHNVYADYRNHPTFFRRMENFIRSLLGYSIVYDQPRLWYTKGQTLEAFVGQSKEAADIAVSTRSCWQQRWNARYNGRLSQCGLCAACLLRRMSMHAAGVTESPETYTIGDLTAPNYAAAIPRSNSIRLSRTMVEHGSVGARHFQQLATLAGAPDRALMPYAFELARATGLSGGDALQRLRNLLVRHAEEWHRFVDSMGPSTFLRKWAAGG